MAYSAEEKKIIKSRIVEEVEKKRSLHDILENDILGEFPRSTTIYEWLNENSKYYDEAFSANYARARDIRADKIFEEMLTIADTPQKGIITKTGGVNGIETTEADMIQHRRLQVDTRKWILGRMAPKKYGDKIETTITGGDKPVQTLDVGQLSSEALEEIAKQANANKPKS